MVDILEFVVDITLKWSIFYQKNSQSGDMIYVSQDFFYSIKLGKMKMGNRIYNGPAKMSMHFLAAKCVML